MLSSIKKLFKKVFSKTSEVNYDKKIIVDRGIIYKHIIALLNTNRFENLKKYNADKTYWACVVLAIIEAESNFNMVSVYWEKDLGNNGYDKYTGRKYLSEGLMQLSYSDAKYYGCPFNWELDKNKKDQDETKTIFNIANNIECGLTILDKLVNKRGKYIFDYGNYWAVLKPSNKRHNVFIKAFEMNRLVSYYL